MRLLNTETLHLENFGDMGRRPPYAILSHTWSSEEDEVSFEDITTSRRHDLASKPGYQKIQYTCAQALKDGYQYAWIDTCCIDKTSSAELSEAINSMFAWYKQSGVCYVFLTDIEHVPQDEREWVVESLYFQTSPSENFGDLAAMRFTGSRWFSRGWTLQELIAPKHVRFFSKYWQNIGSLDTLVNLIAERTHIPKLVLLKSRPFTDFSIAQRMSWAASRTTSRLEDEAYCLLGLFGVYMPLLYGEGRNAFVRLQRQIIQHSSDQSIFVWNCEKRHEPQYLACSTTDFIESGAISSLRRPKVRAPYLVNNRGLEITLRTTGRIIGQPNSSTFAVLECVNELDPTSFVGMVLDAVDPNDFDAANDFIFRRTVSWHFIEPRFNVARTCTILNVPERPPGLGHPISVRCFLSRAAVKSWKGAKIPCDSLDVIETYPRDAWDHG